ncbi:MAG: tRNA (adenine-N1)-methyltransferase [Candidatus Velamenicoccus archaeovorus]
MGAPFEPGERVLLIDGRGRRYLLTRLRPGERWHSHGGAVPHDLIIGSDEGVRVHSTGGMPFTCFRPRLADFVLKMPRGAQVVYPKDLGAILVETDVYPGARVLEAGTGSGALTIALGRAVGPEGRVVTYELRPEFHRKAAANVESFFGKVPPWIELREGDLRGVVGTGERFDRVVLDMPEPWGVLGAVAEVLEPGGVACGFLPTTVQVQTLVLSMQERGFDQVQTFELLHRPWHVTARSVRPDHRMIGHTGFITIGRRAEPPGD